MIFVTFEPVNTYEICFFAGSKTICSAVNYITGAVALNSDPSAIDLYVLPPGR
jgi:hypothetical protein